MWCGTALKIEYLNRSPNNDISQRVGPMWGYGIVLSQGGLSVLK